MINHHKDKVKKLIKSQSKSYNKLKKMTTEEIIKFIILRKNL